MSIDDKMLGSWAEIQQALRRYPTRSESGDVTTFDWLEAGEVSAIFQVKFAELQGRPRIFIGVNVAKDGPTRAHEALVINSELAVGALVAFKGNIVLRQVMTVGRFDAAELFEVIASMAQQVDVTHGRLMAQVAAPK